MCVSKCENCIDCRAWEGFWETAVTSPDWMKAFDVPESPREISPRFSDCALAVMGFMAANYPARIESKCKCRQHRSSPVYQGTSRAWHWRCWMVRQIGTISAVLLGRREKNKEQLRIQLRGHKKEGEEQVIPSKAKAMTRWTALVLSFLIIIACSCQQLNNSTTKGDKKGRTWLQLQLSSCVEVLSNLSLDVCRNKNNFHQQLHQMTFNRWVQRNILLLSFKMSGKNTFLNDAEYLLHIARAADRTRRVWQ